MQTQNQLTSPALNPVCGPLQTWEDALFRLMEIPSVSGSESAVAIALEEIMSNQFPGAAVFRQHVGPDRWNVIMQKGNPLITLTSHIDVVPGGPAPSYDDDRIWGRGACDAKGQIASQLWGLQRSIQEGLSDYRCAYVVGEETDTEGARKFLELPTTKYILNGEPTKNQFVRRSWGAVQIQIEAFGKGSHSSFGTADSAIHKLLQDLHSLTTDLPAGLDINIGTIRGGTASNVQAAHVVCEACARIRGGEEPLLELLQNNLKSSSWSHRAPASPGLELFVPDFAPERDIEVRFASDASIYKRIYENVLLFGPGDIGLAHTEHESISREELKLASLMISHLLNNLER